VVILYRTVRVRCLSGRKGCGANALTPKGVRGFESHPHRRTFLGQIDPSTCVLRNSNPILFFKSMNKLDWKLPATINKEALLLVAHPDDETIFCGGTMLTYPDWNWTVICLTHSLESPYQYSQVRSQQFRRAMEGFKQMGVNIISYKDLGQEDKGNERDITEADIGQWKTSIQALKLSPNIVFTHNTKGEYGHAQHIAVNKIAHEIFSNVWEFICPGATNVSPQPTKQLSNEVKLSSSVLARKKEIFNNNYVSEWELWNNLRDVMQYEFETGPEIFTAQAN
jgi:hypothetical protein